MKTVGLISANYSSGNFGPLMQNRTMASLPYGGRYRLIDFTLSNMINSGITEVGVVSPYNSGSLIDHVGDGKAWSLARKEGGLFMMPGSVFGLRANGARFILRDMIANKAFLTRSKADYAIVSGSSDVYNIDYTELIKQHRNSANPITIMYKTVENAEDYRGFFIEKNIFGNVASILTEASGTAMYFMDCFIIDCSFLMELLDWYSTLEHMDLFSVLKEELPKFTIGTYEFDGYLGKINGIEDYLRVSRDMFDYDMRNDIFCSDRTIYTKAQDEAPTLYKPGSSVTESIVAAGCRIEGSVDRSIIFRSTTVGAGASVSNSVVMMHGSIGEGAVLDNVICDKYVTVSPGTKLIGGKEPIILAKGARV